VHAREKLLAHQSAGTPLTARKRVQATERFKARQIPGPKPYYATKEWPSLWFEPMEVWEVRALLWMLAAHVMLTCQHRPARGLEPLPAMVMHARPVHVSSPELIACRSCRGSHCMQKRSEEGARRSGART
jgi:hypothetical protein